jgi:hypothetical protein
VGSIEDGQTTAAGAAGGRLVVAAGSGEGPAVLDAPQPMTEMAATVAKVRARTALQAIPTAFRQAGQ